MGIPFIQRLDITADVDQVLRDLAALLDGTTDWVPGSQIGLRHRPGAENVWKDALGSLTDPSGANRRAWDRDFSQWNDGIPEYTRSMLDQLAAAEGVTWGRVRFMRSMPKTGLSMHVDPEPRYHLVLETNPSAIFAECYTDRSERCTGYHMPRDGHWYRVDTTREHFIYNGGWTPRIHLLATPAS